MENTGTRKRIEFYDSLGGSGRRYIEFARDFVSKTCGEGVTNMDEWAVEVVESPQQVNGVDCGAFVCMNSHALIRAGAVEGAYKADDIQKGRWMIAATLLGMDVAPLAV